MALQVFEYLSTDLKKYMDRTGKGANGTPVPKKLIKVPHRPSFTSTWQIRHMHAFPRSMGPLNIHALVCPGPQKLFEMN